MKKPKCDNEILSGDVLLRAGDDEFARLAAALGHPSRVAIVRLLKERAVCVCGEIVEQLPQAQSTVSQHLKVLKDAGWIRAEGDGTRVCYTLNKDASKRFASLLRAL